MVGAASGGRERKDGNYEEAIMRGRKLKGFRNEREEEGGEIN